MEEQEKRHRGGQPGNRNALKHGFYTDRLAPAQVREFCNIINTEGLDPELAAIRVKLRSCLARDPGNGRVIRKAAKLVAGWYSSKHALDKQDGLALEKFCRVFLEARAIITSPLGKLPPFEKGLPRT